MKVMVIGGGGREHAIIKKLKQSKDISELYALPGNGGIAADATCVGIGATDIAATKSITPLWRRTIRCVSVRWTR